jgi:hypothetical protein
MWQKRRELNIEISTQILLLTEKSLASHDKQWNNFCFQGNTCARPISLCSWLSMTYLKPTTKPCIFISAASWELVDQTTKRSERAAVVCSMYQAYRVRPRAHLAKFDTGLWSNCHCSYCTEQSEWYFFTMKIMAVCVKYGLNAYTHTQWYRVPLQRVKRPWHGVNHPLPSRAEIKERVEITLLLSLSLSLSLSGSSSPLLGRNLPLILTI